MKKPDPGTPQDVSNKMKLKGLQKLKHYCEMCKKQCRDQNGFKSHQKSSAHINNMRLFASNPDNFIEQFSKQFEEQFFDLLKRKYQAKRVLANNVYKDMITDKGHIHMNSTRWNTLTSFVKYLAEQDRIQAEFTDNGLYITYTDQVLKAQKEKKEEEKRIKIIEKQEKAQQKQLESEIKYAQQLEIAMNKKNEQKIQNLPSAHENDMITFELPFQNKQETVTNNTSFKFEDLSIPLKQNDSVQQKNNINIESEANEPIIDDLDDFPWLYEGLIVKIIDKKLKSGQFYKEKAVVLKVNEDNIYMGQIQLINDSSVKLNIDQQFLETVIPKLGEKVMIVQPGENAKKIGILKELQLDKQIGTIEIDKQGKNVKINVPFEFFSKIK